MDSKKVIILVVLLLISWFFFSHKDLKRSLLNPSPVEKKQVKSGTNYIDSVNFHLRKTTNDIEHDRLAIEEENLRLQRYFTGTRGNEDLPALPQGTSFHESQASPYDNILGDLEESGSHSFGLSAADRIHLLKEQEALKQDYNKRYREEFIRAFKDNALKQGFVLDVDPLTLKVTNIRKVPTRDAASTLRSTPPSSQSSR